MSKKKRRNFSISFKSKVAIEALKERMTLSELASKYDLHPTQITKWEKQLASESEHVFERGNKDKRLQDEGKVREELYRVVSSKWRITG